MSIERWQTAWRQLIAPGAPFEVVTPDDGAPRYFRHAAHNLLQVIDAGRVHGDREFLVWQSQRLTFNQYFDQVDRLAGQMVARFGLQPGERVAIAMRNQPAWLVAFAAILRCGAVCVPLNSWGLRDELQYALQDSGSRLLLCDEARLDTLREDLAREQRATIVVGARKRALPEYCLRFEDLISAPALPYASAGNRSRRASTDPLHLGHHQSRQGRSVQSPGNLPGAVCPGFPGRVLRHEFARAYRRGDQQRLSAHHAGGSSAVPCQRLACAVLVGTCAAVGA